MRRSGEIRAAKTAEETATETLTRTARPWNVVVHDDPITLMNYVTKVFMDVFGYPQHKAQRLMMEVHKTGRSVVWTGGRERAETYVQKLLAFHLLATLEQVDAD
jgi:ATP-dependent Clp protease adaptor protein ClpS